jgi:hypothetical protein
MFDYTKAIYRKTKKDLDLALSIFQFGTQVLYIAYLIYLVFSANNSIWYLHLCLLIICIPFLIFDLITTKNIKEIKNEKISIFGKKRHKEKLSKARNKRKNVLRLKFYTSHTIKIFVLASSLYRIITSPSSVHPLSIMCTTVMVLLWILQIIFEVLKLVLEGRGELFMEALQADVEFVTKPANAVKNAFKKLTGQEVEPKKEKSKDRIYLDGLVDQGRDEKEKAKVAKKAERSEKLSSWLDSHLPRFGAKRNVKNEEPVINELPPALPSEIEESEEEKV